MKIDEAPLVAISYSHDIRSLVISPDCRHVTLCTSLAGRQAVVHDGTIHASYHAIQPGSLVFSPDGTRLAYVALDASKSFVVLDGNEGPKFERLSNGPPAFSPNGRRLGYAALRQDAWFVIVDGQEGRPFEDTGVGCPYFSPDSRRVAYEALRNGRWRVVLDEVEGKEYDAIIKGDVRFSSDSSRTAYGARLGQQRFIVLDGIEGKGYKSAWAEDSVFSPDSRHFAYRAWNEPYQFVVLDGRESQAFKSIAVGAMGFTTDSRHLSYAAETDSGWYVLADQTTFGPYAKVKKPVSLTPNGDHIVFIAQPDGYWANWQVMLDGTPISPDGMQVIPFTCGLMSPDGARLGYIEIKEGIRAKMSLVLASVRQGGGRLIQTANFDEIWDDSVVFSSDSGHVAFWARRDDKWIIVVDDQECRSYDPLIESASPQVLGAVPGSKPVFDDTGLVRVIARRGRELLKVEIHV